MESKPRHQAVTATEHRDGAAETKTLSLITESVLRVWVDGRLRFSATRTPGEEPAQALGLCLGAGLIRDRSGVSEIFFSPEEDPDRVEVRRRTGTDDEPGPPPPLLSDAHLDLGRVPDLVRALFDCQRIRAVTRSTHAALLLGPDFKPAFTAEDVSRQSAMDKVLGAALMAGRLGDIPCALLTCRINREALTKFARARVPILASVSRPTAEAVQMARELDLTLVLCGDQGTVLVFSGDRRIR